MVETYREINTTEVDSGSPLTAELTEAFRANPIAIAEGASGAPKIADKTFLVNGTTTINSIGAYGGMWIDSQYFSTALGTETVTVSFSDDGSTFYGSTTIISRADGENAVGVFFVDFSSGAYKAIYMSPSGRSATSGTVTGLSESVVSVKVTDASGTVGAIVRFQGGESAS